MEAEIEKINTEASKSIIAGWWIGLGYFNWFANDPQHVTFLGHLVLYFGGTILSSIIIGQSLSLMFAFFTKILTGSIFGSTAFYRLTQLLGPILAFFAVAPVINFVIGVLGL